MQHMNDHETTEAPSSQGPGIRFARVGVAVSWLLIAVAIVLWTSGQGAAVEESELPESPVAEGLLIDLQSELFGKVGLGLHDLFPAFSTTSQAAPLAVGGAADQLAHAILVSVDSIESGREEVLEIQRSEPGDPVVEMAAPWILAAFDAIEDGTSLAPSTADALVERFGWYGSLLVAMTSEGGLEGVAGAAARTVVTMLVIGGTMFLAAVLGFLGLIIVLVLALTGSLRSGVATSGHHGIYAETFAGWLLLLLGLQYVAGLVSPPGLEPLSGTVAFFASLVMLAWPVVRGLPWATVRADIGLARPRAMDVPMGVAGWAMALPFMAVGLGLTLVLTFVVELLSGSAPEAGHPAQQAIFGAGTWTIVQVFILATVAAPIVEEVMFRGVLLTHLRGASRAVPIALSLLFAMLVSSVIFAVIHPQGLLFVPPLAGLAVGFCIIREIRGSIVPAIVAHAVSNGMVMTLNIVLAAS